jgi:hypothetical protein
VTIADAIWTAGDPLRVGAVWWEGPNYRRQDDQGTYGTVTFAGDQVVGAFFDMHSARNPVASGSTPDLRPFFAGIPPDLFTLAQTQTMRNLIFPYRGREEPLVTAAFWSEGDRLTAAEPWSQAVANGAHLVRIEVMDTEEAIAEARDDYDFDEWQIALLRTLYSRRLRAPDGVVVLSDRERGDLVSKGDEGVAESLSLLSSIGIVLPAQ